MEVSGQPNAQAPLPPGKNQPCTFAQEAVLVVFREETPFLPLPGCDPPYLSVRSL